MNQRIAIAALLLAAFGTAHSADVYRSTAPDGTVIYSDRPQGSNAQFVFVARRSSQGRPAAARAPAPATDQSAPQTAPTLPEGPSAAELRSQRQKNCEIARETVDRYTLTNRLYRTNAAGEREYLDEAAMAEARAKAAADVEDWCS